MNFKQLIVVCVAGVSLNADTEESEFPFGSEEKFWEYVETNTMQIRFDVKGIIDGQWARTLTRVNVSYDRMVDGPIRELTKREFNKGVLAAFAKYSDEDLRAYSEFTSFIWCLSPSQASALYQISWRYTLIEKDGTLVVPDHIRNPELSLEESSYVFDETEVDTAELFVRKNGQLTAYLESWPFSGPAGQVLAIEAGKVAVPAKYIVGNNDGELVLYFKDGSHKVVNLGTGNPASYYPPLDQPEMIFKISADWYAQKAAGTLTAQSVMPLQIMVVKGRGRDFSLEYSSDFKSWNTLTEVTTSRVKEWIGDYNESPLRFYRVRLHD